MNKASSERSLLFIGLMSGTSMDGIDAAVVDLSNHQLIAGKTYPYAASLKTRIQQLMSSNQTTVSEIYQCNRLLGEAFAEAALRLIEEASLAKTDICAIGSHGQTISHAPQAKPSYTVQLGCGHTIAALTGLPVVADFRVRDMVLGGQGAPFAPLYHQVLFSTLEKPLAILNLGGIANLTYLLPHGEVRGYDVGPSNALLDAWIFEHLDLAYDENGKWASQGTVNPELLSALLADPFFSLSLPKSIGKEYFSLTWLKRVLKPMVSAEDVQATLLALTVSAIEKAIKQDAIGMKRLLVCGGGVHNAALMQQLTSKLPHLEVLSTAKLGVDPDFIEAMLFAWLASQTLNEIPLELTAITGAKTKTVLGCVYPCW